MKKIIYIMLIFIVMMISMVSGTDYYVSNLGDDSNNGLTSGTPWKTIAKVNTIAFNPGDVIMFRSGHTWNHKEDKHLLYDNNTRITSYYGGDRPLFIGAWDVSNTANWTDMGNNLWNATTVDSADSFVFYSGSNLTKVSNPNQLTSQGHFYYNSSGDSTTVYSVGNPATVYNGLYIARKNNILSIKGGENISINNIHFKYGGAHGIETISGYNITIDNCVLSWIGGTYLTGTTKYGNCIQFWDDNTLMTVKNSIIYDCYDAGVTPQSDSCGHDISNITIAYNILYNNRYNIEIFNQAVGCLDNQGHLNFTNVTHNTMADAGRGFHKKSGYDIIFWKATRNVSTNNFTNNIFYNSLGTPIHLEGAANHANWLGTYPNFQNNIYDSDVSPYLQWENSAHDTVARACFWDSMECSGTNDSINFVDSSHSFVPIYDSFVCDNATDGTYLGAVDCESYISWLSRNPSNTCPDRRVVTPVVFILLQVACIVIAFSLISQALQNIENQPINSDLRKFKYMIVIGLLVTMLIMIYVLDTVVAIFNCG